MNMAFEAFEPMTMALTEPMLYCFRYRNIFKYILFISIINTILLCFNIRKLVSKMVNKSKAIKMNHCNIHSAV